MPPKKEEPVKKVLLGRPGNHVKMGIVGLPNVGKSTFFNLLCSMNVAAENYPFCTIDPNVSKVPVPDERFDQLVASFKPKSVVPAVLTVTDIAGLVKGASEGAGLGNAFLSHIQAVDGIFHMCRAFANDEITHVEGRIDPAADLEIIHSELRLKDLAIVTAKVDGMRKNVERKVGGKEALEEFNCLEKMKALMESGKDIRFGDWSPAEIEVINRYNMITAKPMIYLVNLSERDYVRKANKHLVALAAWLEARGTGDKMIPISCEFEGKVAAAKESGGQAAADAYCKEIGAKSSFPRVIKTGYHALNLQHFFTAGPDEVRAWTIKNGSTAPQAAGCIHTDIQKNFIAAEIYPFEAFKEHGSEAKVKEHGLLRTQGKLYEMQDGDVVFFKHGA
jgi:obg-like ATPase 1